MELKNVPDPIPCYFLLENSAKSKPTPVTVPFSEDLVPGYDLCTRPTPFLGTRCSSPPPSPAPKFLTVPSLSQDDPEVPAVIPPKRPLSCSSSSGSSSTLQSRGDDVAMATIPGIAVGDAGPGQQLIVPVPDISVTAASSSPSPIIGGGGAGSTRRGKGGTRVLLRGRSADEVGSLSDRSVTPESPFFSPPPATLPPHTLTEMPKRQQDQSSPHSESYSMKSSPHSESYSMRYPFSGDSARLGEAGFQEARRERGERGSLSAMSPLHEETGEDSLYSSFEGSEPSDQENEEKKRHRRRDGRPLWGRRGGRETRRKGETVQPRLLKVMGGVRVGVGEMAGEEGSDAAEDTPESVPARKISDCSNRSVDSGTKMSEVSKDDDELSHRKLSDLSEASQNDFEVEEERRSESPAPSSPAPLLKRSGSVHNKVDFFNQWIQSHQLPPSSQQSGRKKQGRPRRLLRSQSEVVFAGLRPPPSPRRGSLLPAQDEDT